MAEAYVTGAIYEACCSYPGAGRSTGQGPLGDSCKGWLLFLGLVPQIVGRLAMEIEGKPAFAGSKSQF